MDNNLKRSIILEHYQSPKNKGLINDESYIKVNMNNESCIDEINLMVKLEDERIKDVRFDEENKYLLTQVFVQRRKKGYLDVNMILYAPFDSTYYF